MDSGLLTFLIKVFDNSAQGNINVEKDGLPEWVKRLLHLAYAVSERKGARRGTIKIPFLEQVANISIGGWHSFIDMLGFIGEASMAFMKLLEQSPFQTFRSFQHHPGNRTMLMCIAAMMSLQNTA